MFLAGVNFLLQYRLLFGREVRPLLRDAEFRAYAVLALLAGFLLAFYFYTHHLYGLEASLRHAFFQVVSILTTTGFASVDFAGWVVPAQAVLVLLMFVGGSAGSGAGGIKVVRWLLLFGFLRREITRTLHPQAVLPLRLGQRVVSEEALRQVSVFVFLYTLLFGAGTLALASWRRTSWWPSPPAPRPSATSARASARGPMALTPAPSLLQGGPHLPDVGGADRDPARGPPLEPRALAAP